MTVLLILIILLSEVIHCLELHRLLQLYRETVKTKHSKAPPKARGSFVVKRMEERLKEALYE